MANRFLSNIRINDAYTLPASDGTVGQVISTDGAGNLSFIDASSGGAPVIQKDDFVGDGVTTQFTLGQVVGSVLQTQVYMDGVYQEKETYSVANDVITFTSAPPNGVSIEVISFTSINFAGDFTVDSLQFTGGTGLQGTVTWNADEETLDLVKNGTTLQLGQEVQVHVKNQTGSTIPDGTPVYVTGTLGNSGRLTVAPMIADGSILAKFFLGVTTEDIANGEDGKVTTFGKIRGIDTSMYTEGQNLFVSASTAGAFQTTAPVSPNLDLEIAIVINSHANNGTIFVRAQQGYYLGMLHDVAFSGLADKDLLVYNSATGVWENSKTLGNITTGNITTSGTVDGVDVSEFKSDYDTHNHDERYYTETEIDTLLTNKANWDTAYSWGDHALAGYLTSYTETDPVFSASAAAGITSTQITNWDTAYGWGDHSTAGYLTSYTETDPVFSASDAAGITATDISNWDTAYGWGDHDGLYLPIGGKAADSNLLDGIDSSNFFRTDGTYPNTDMNDTVEGYWHVASGSANLPVDAYGHRWDYDHIQNGQWVFQMYSPTGGDVDLWFRQKRNSTATAWQKVITSGNIGSQSVSYASTSGNASSLQGRVVGSSTDNIAFLGSTRNLVINNPEAYTGEVRLGAAWDYGGVYASSTLTMASSSDINFVIGNNVYANLTTDYFSHNGKILMGTFPQSTTNSGAAWIGRAADRALGTMTVQLGGDANRTFEVVDHAWSVVTFNVNGSGTASASESFRAPIFYDSNNTSYYTNPAGTSYLYDLDMPHLANGTESIRANIGGQENWRAIALSGGSQDNVGWGIHGTSRSIFGRSGTSIHFPDDGSFRLHTNGWDTEFEVEGGGEAWLKGGLRASILYDNNNTGYYVDPNSTSKLDLIIDTNGAGYISRYHSGSDFTAGTLVTTNIPSAATNGASFVIEVTGKSYSSDPPFRFMAQGYLYNNGIINASGVNNGDLRLTYIKVMNLGGNLAFWWPRISYWNSFEVRVIDAGGSSKNRVTGVNDSSEPSSATKVTQINLHKSVTYDENTNSGELFATAFLDANNTAYYVDPASTSRIRKTNLVASGSGWEDGLNLFSSDATNKWNLLVDDGASDAFRIAYNSSERLNFETGGAITATGSLRAPIFYDSNDTNVRLDSTRLVLRGADPTIVFRDTNHTSAMWHVNSHLMYLLRGNGDTESWSQVNGQWPVYWDLGNNNAYFGGVVSAVTSVSAPIFYDNNNTAYYVNPASQSNLNGPVGISTSPESSFGLTIQGGSNGGQAFKFISGSYASAGTIEYPFFATGLTINNKGQVGSNGITFLKDGSSAGRITISSGSVAYITSSDYRLKENISPMTGSIDRVMSLKPIRFNMIGVEETVDGFLAHEVQDVVPEAISGQKDAIDHNGNPDYQGIDQSKLVPLLVGAIQELKAEVEALKQQLNGAN